MPSLGASYAAILAALAEHYGPAAPTGTAAGLDPFAALVTALLGRAADPRKAERACDALVDAGLLDPRILAEADRAEIDDALKSSGITVPSRVLAPIQRVARWFFGRYPDSAADSLDSVGTEELRAELAGLNGIGPATADALLLLALSRPVYPLDRATYRILIRHGWLDPSADYDEGRDAVERPGQGNPITLAQLSDGLTRVGSEFCRVRVAKCDRCPLRGFLPEGGPVEPDEFATDP